MNLELVDFLGDLTLLSLENVCILCFVKVDIVTYNNYPSYLLDNNCTLLLSNFVSLYLKQILCKQYMLLWQNNLSLSIKKFRSFTFNKITVVVWLKSNILWFIFNSLICPMFIHLFLAFFEVNQVFFTIPFSLQLHI